MHLLALGAFCPEVSRFFEEGIPVLMHLLALGAFLHLEGKHAFLGASKS